MKRIIYINVWNSLNITLMVLIGVPILMQLVVAVVLVLIAKENEFLDETKRSQFVKRNDFITLYWLL